MNVPIISICIPAFSNVKSLKRLLDSIVIQTFKQYEVIITDDSFDDSVEILVKEYNDSRFIYYKNSKQLGSPENWNMSISLTTTNYIKIMHHDDYFASNESLEKIVEALCHGKFVFVQSNHVVKGDIISYNKPLRNVVNQYLNKPILFLLGNIIGAPSAVAYHKKSIVYDKNIKWYVDIEFYIRYLSTLDINECIYIEEPLINIGIDDNRVTNECINNNEIVYKEFFYTLFKGYSEELYTFKDVSFCLYKFYKIHNIKQFQEVSKYINGVSKIISYTIFIIYKVRVCL